MKNRASEAIAFLVRLHQQDAECRRQRDGDDGREHRRHGDRHGELLVELPGDAGDEPHRHEHGGEDQRDGHHRPLHFLHRLDRRFAHGEAAAHLVLDGLDHDDRVVDHDADREHHAEQRQRVDREPEQLERRERREQRHRHGQHRDQRGAPVLQEQEHDDQHEDQRLDEGMDDFFDRRFDELGGVVDDLVVEALRELAGEAGDLRLQQAGRLQGVGAGDQRHGHERGGLAVDRRDVAVAARAEFDPPDVPDADERPIRLRADDDVGELVGLDQPALHAQRVLVALAPCRRRLANLSRRHLDVLLANRACHVARGDAERGHAVGPQPDAHAEVRAEDLDVAHALDALQFVDDVDVAVVADEERVVRAVRGEDREVQQGVGRLLAHGDAGVDHLRRQLRVGLRHPVLHLDCGQVGITLEFERHRNRRAAVVAAHRADVQHVGGAVDLLVDRRADGLLDDVRAGAEVEAVHLHRGQGDVGEFADRQADQRQRADEQQEQRDDDREDRAIDEKT